MAQFESTSELTTQIIDTARKHQLNLSAGSLTVNEAGLDYRVAIGQADDGEKWVLRMPRRAAMESTIAEEAAILKVVRSHLSVAVPDWKIVSNDLIAYPLLPGEPGLTIDATSGELCWRLEATSTRYAEELGRLIAAIHGIDKAAAISAGIKVQEPAEVRAQWSKDLATVAANFEISPALYQRWTRWIAEDSFWPTWSVFTHGELYPAHVLIDSEDSITAVLDWTTAKVADSGRDFVYQHAMGSEQAFRCTVDAYHRAGGKTWPRLADHCAELWSASPIAFGLYALLTAEPKHHAAASAQLMPE